MKHIIAVVTILLLWCGVAHAQQPTAQVVTTCGTPPANYSASAFAYPTVDHTGALCSNASGGGGGGAATAAAQTGVQTTIAPGTAPASANVDGCIYNSTAPAPTNGQTLAVQCGPNGSLRAGNPMNTMTSATASTIVTGGTAVTAITGPVNGCAGNNPITAAGQNIATAEVLYINFVGAATTTEGGNVFAVQPGQPFTCPGGITGNLSAVAATSGHKFSLSVW